MTARMLMFHVPKDEELLASLGVVTLRHEHLNHILKMTIKTIAGLSPQEALDATAFEGSASLRRRIRKLARKRLGEGEPLLKLQALMTRAQRLSEKRNQFIHGIWAQELDGEPGLYADEGDLQPLPSAEELEDLAADMLSLLEELNEARFGGFLAEALSKTSNAT